MGIKQLLIEKNYQELTKRLEQRFGVILEIEEVKKTCESKFFKELGELQ